MLESSPPTQEWFAAEPLERYKYPRTPHLPWSPGQTGEDIALKSIEALSRLTEIVVTEKFDGENTTLYHDYMHARSTSYTSHPSRHWLKRFHAEIQHEIPEGFRICGEDLFATHSIHYDSLPSYFLVFAIFENAICLSWDDTLQWCELLNLKTVPTLYRGSWSQDNIHGCWTGKSLFGPEQEGYVVRNAASFPLEAFHENSAKFVRAGHVRTDDHWMHKLVVPNVVMSTKIDHAE